MNKKYLFNFLILFAFTLLCSINAKSQNLNDYVASTSNETWTPLTDGVVGFSEDNYPPEMSISFSDYNFNFKYDGVQITDLLMTACGTLKFNRDSPYNYYSQSYPYYSDNNYLTISGIGGSSEFLSYDTCR